MPEAMNDDTPSVTLQDVDEVLQRYEILDLWESLSGLKGASSVRSWLPALKPWGSPWISFAFG